MNQQEYRSAMSRFVTGVTVVTANGPDGPIGITANSFASVSLEPPLVLWSIANNSRKHLTMTSVENYAINILSESQKNIALEFSGSTKSLKQTDFSIGFSGVPIIKDTVAVFECKRHIVYDGGDHSIILGLVKFINDNELDPLIFFNGGFGKI